MANGIIIIDKPQDWTSVDVCAPAYAAHTPGTLGLFHLRGGSEFRLAPRFCTAKRSNGAFAPKLGA